MQKTYYAISSIGWGKAEDAAEARRNYYEAQERNYRSTLPGTDRAARFLHLASTAPPVVWMAPEGAVGFNLGGLNGMTWEMADGTYAPAVIEQRVDA